MKTKLLLICLLLFTSQVFAEEFKEYHGEFIMDCIPGKDKNYYLHEQNKYKGKCSYRGYGLISYEKFKKILVKESRQRAIILSSDNKFENENIMAPWNNPLLKDDSMAPWNNPLLEDDIMAPWNNPWSDDYYTNEYLRDKDVYEEIYYWD